MVDVNMVEELIEDLKLKFLPENMVELLNDSEFKRGRAAMVYEIIDAYERLIANPQDDSADDED